MGGIADALGMGGPQAPDPYRTANAQGVANVEAARVTAGLNRPDQHTPYGSLTWKQGESTFDQAGYDKALAQYQQDLNAWNSRTTTPGADGGPAPQGNTYGERLAGGALNQPRNIATGAPGSAPVAPDKAQFTTGGNDRWTSTITLDPRVQAIVDAQLKNQGTSADLSNTALANVAGTLANPISTAGLPSRLSPQEAFNQVAGHLYNLQNMYTAAEQMYASGRAPVEQAGKNFQSQMAGGTPTLQGPQGDVPQFQRADGSIPQSDEGYRAQIQNALFDQMRSRLDPRFQQRGSDLEAQLAAQGITQGSEAYNREQQNLSMDRNDAYQTAMNNAISGGESAIAGQFGRDMSSRQQTVGETQQEFVNRMTSRGMTSEEAKTLFNSQLAGRGLGMQEYNAALGGQNSSATAALNAINSGTNLVSGAPRTMRDLSGLYSDARSQDLGEQMALRNQILNELNALRTGAQVQMPQFGSGQSGANVAAAPIAQMIGQNYQSEVAGNNAMMGGLSSLGSAALGSQAIMAPIMAAI